MLPSMVPWCSGLALWTLNPATRVRISVGPFALIVFFCLLGMPSLVVLSIQLGKLTLAWASTCLPSCPTAKYVRTWARSTLATKCRAAMRAKKAPPPGVEPGPPG